MAAPENYEGSGAIICDVETQEVQPWIYYAFAAFGLLGGIVFSSFSVPSLWGKVKGDFEGGLAGIAIALIFLGGGAAAIFGARSKGRVFRVQFFKNGCAIGSRGRDSQFIGYGELPQIGVVLRNPSARTQAVAIAQGLRSLLAGNAFGIGRAFADSREGGVVIFQFQGKTIIVPTLALTDAELIGVAASSKRDDDVIVYDS